ncbi:MAG: SurA N-terminal domain-containing protein [Chromatiales bacterium]|nr:SurA N-terminal domain-containing protein [Chromatiales bacterium]
MLQAIRDRAQGWIAWTIVVLISIPFALWGIQQYIGGGSQAPVATVNGEDIDDGQVQRAFTVARQELARLAGPGFDPTSIADRELRAQVVDGLIDQELVRQKAGELGLGAGSGAIQQYIQELPELQVGGQFDYDRYQQALRSQGLSPDGFALQVRDDLVHQQLARGIAGTDFLTPGEQRAVARLTGQTRSGHFFRVSKSTAAVGEAGDGDVIAYYEANRERWRQAERVKLAYVELQIDDIASTIKVDDGELQRHYESAKSSFTQPEQRRARHILIRLDANADETARTAASDRIEAARKRIAEGESFDDVAREVSDDKGSAPAGGDLGSFRRGVMAPAFDDAVFGMQTGELRGPIETRFGLHLIRLDSVEPERVRALNEIRDQLRTLVAREKAEKIYFEQAERLAQLAYEQPDSLEPAAEELGLTRHTTDWVTRETRDGILASPRVSNAAFSDEVLGARHNSDPVEVAPEHLVVLRVTDHQDSRIPLLDEVRAQVVQALRADRAADLVAARADELANRARNGAAFAELAVAAGGSAEKLDAVARHDTNHPPELIATLFGLAKPAAGGSSVGTVQFANGDSGVVSLESVRDGETPGTAADTVEYRRAMGRAQLTAYLRTLRSVAEIERFDSKGDSE